MINEAIPPSSIAPSSSAFIPFDKTFLSYSSLPLFYSFLQPLHSIQLHQFRNIHYQQAYQAQYERVNQQSPFHINHRNHARPPCHHHLSPHHPSRRRKHPGIQPCRGIPSLFTPYLPIPPPWAPLTNSPSQSSKAVKDLTSYLGGLTTQAAFSTATSVLATAVPSDVIEQIQFDPNGYYQSVATATALPSWFTAMPTPVQQFFSSVGQAEASILSKDAKGPAPTNGVNVKLTGAVLAAGGAVMAML